MRKLIAILSILLLPLAATAQFTMMEPASWEEAFANSEVEVGATVEVVFTASIDDGWYMYSNDFDPDLGPIPIEFTYEPNASYELIGGPKPIKPKKKYDEVWEGEVSIFFSKAEFRQTIKVLNKDFKGITGMISYQVCSDESGQCIPFDYEFEVGGITVTGEAKSIPPVESTPTPVEKPVVNTPTESTPESSAPVETNPLGNGQTLVPVEEGGETNEAPATTPVAAEQTIGRKVISYEEGVPVVEMESFLTDPTQGQEKIDYWAYMIAAFLAGLTALLTPCVFPMIPLTVSFFTNKGKKSHVFFYGFSIIFIYGLFGAIVAPFMGPGMANHLSTSWLPNMIFFAVFIVFALSFFGLFEITLPNKLVNKIDQQSDRKGLIGVFFMAFTLVLVSFSCTGPLVGALLVEAAGGQRLKPILGMLAFSSAFAIPFTIFAFFPGLMKSLPKSGGWLNSVKVVLGFVELALAFKFFSIADLAYGWGLLDREINLAIWVTIFTLLGFYLLGKLRLPGDSKLETISVLRLVLSIITFTFVVYLIPGMFGAPLKALSGLLPPSTTHDFDLQAMIRDGGEGGHNNIADLEGCEEPLYADFLHFPHGLSGYFAYEQALECARAQGKPLFIDFTGHGCVNCRKMEDNVWAEKPVLDRLREDFVILALYVDDKTTLDESMWYISAHDGKLKTTLARQNMDVELQRANNNAQPYYLILDHNEKVLVDPIGYTPEVSKFIQYLDQGKKAFEAQQKETLADQGQ